MLVGRSTEEKRLEALLERAAAGMSATLVLRGEAGIGKTALLDRAVGRADGFRVLRAVGVESEAAIAYAGLQQLLRPVVGAFAELPAHQARALGTALALEEGPAPERLLVAAATLTLLAVAADERPLLCVVDDAQWLDDATAETLVFAARRLQAEGVLLIFAARDPATTVFSAHGLPEMRVQGLATAAAKTLLTDRAPDLADRAADRLVEVTRGNPLALLELPAGLNAAQRAGAAPLDEPLTVSAEIERAFLARTAALSPEARRALLVVAAGDPANEDSLWAVLEAEELDAAPLAAARATGLLAAAHLEFCHPLARSAVYQLARPSDRRAAHAALAAVTREPDRRAWHLAAAADGPDEGVATALEAAGDAARARGGVAAESKALERAAELTADPLKRGGRLLRAALAAEAAGWLEHAEQMLEDVGELADDPALRAQALARRTYILADRGDFERASALAAVGTELAPPREAAHVLSGGAIMALFHSLDIRNALATAERAWELAAPGSGDDLEVCEVLARAHVLAGHTPEALALARSCVGRAEPGSLLAIDFGTDLLYLEDYGAAREVLEQVVERSRRAQAPGILNYALDQFAKLETRVGNLTRAYALELECVQLTEPLGNDVGLAASLAWLGLVEAMLGRPEGPSHAEHALRIAGPTRDVFNIVRARAALGLEALGRGDAEGAVDWLEPAAAKVVAGGVGLPNFFRLDADLVESLARLARKDAAGPHVARLKQQADASGGGWAPAVAARCAGLLAPDAKLEEWFELSLALHDEDPSPFERARTELCYGERLRRAGKRRAARERLRAALERFERVEALPWAERATSELRATGERVHRRDPTAAERLTPQEFQIATLVAEGLTNREVAARLFLSPKTIEFHLTAVFRKLDVRTRGELIRVFALQRVAELTEPTMPTAASRREHLE